MPASRTTHYEELGVKPNAIPTEIERAWRKYRAEADQVTAAPDRVRETRMRAAYETLSDPVKRAAYDDSLKAPARRSSRGIWLAFFGVLVLGGVAAGAWLLQPPPPPPPGSLSLEQLTHSASQAMARVESVDMSGKATRIGLAFSIHEGVVATSCEGINPMSQLSLQMIRRSVPVKVAQVDEKLGVCKLAAKDVGSWPLEATTADPSPGDTVYATKMNAVGEVSLVEAKVKRVVSSERGKTIEISVAVLPERQGGPVLDSRGRLVGVQILPGGKGYGEVVKITPEWSSRPQAPEPAPPPATVEAETGKTDGPMTREQMEAERRTRIEKALEYDVKGPPPGSRR